MHWPVCLLSWLGHCVFLFYPVLLRHFYPVCLRLCSLHVLHIKIPCPALCIRPLWPYTQSVCCIRWLHKVFVAYQFLIWDFPSIQARAGGLTLPLCHLYSKNGCTVPNNLHMHNNGIMAKNAASKKACGRGMRT